MRSREVGAALHLVQAARGAPELEGQALAAVKRLGRIGRRREHQLDAAVVELVDQRDEAARGVVGAASITGTPDRNTAW